MREFFRAGKILLAHGNFRAILQQIRRIGTEFQRLIKRRRRLGVTTRVLIPRSRLVQCGNARIAQRIDADDGLLTLTRCADRSHQIVGWHRRHGWRWHRLRSGHEQAATRETAGHQQR